MIVWLRDTALILAAFLLLSLTIWLGSQGVIFAVVATPLGIGATVVPAAIVYRLHFEGET